MQVQTGDRVVGEEAARFGGDVSCVVAVPVGRHPVGCVDRERITGSSDRNVDQPLLLLEAVLVGECHVAGEHPVDGVDEVDCGPFEALRGVDRGQGEVALVLARCLGIVGTCRARVQRQVSDEAGEICTGCGGVTDAVDVADAGVPVGVADSDERSDCCQAGGRLVGCDNRRARECEVGERRGQSCAGLHGRSRHDRVDVGDIVSEQHRRRSHPLLDTVTGRVVGCRRLPVRRTRGLPLVLERGRIS